MLWSELRERFETDDWKDAEAELRGVQYDSRRVGAGDVFVAMRGGASDGNRFIDRAVEQGAVAVVTDSAQAYTRLLREHAGVGAALVGRGRRALSEVSSEVFGRPERRLALSAVTGTNGKTTTAFVLEQMLRSVGRACVLVGTIETHVGGEVRESPHTTPESRDLLATFAEGVRAGCTEAVIEASSHALEQERVWGLPVDVAIWTNLTQDHLDYHGTMEAYFEAKSRLFSGVGSMPPRVAVVNADDAYGRELLKRELRSEVLRYGIEGGEYRAEAIVLRAGATEFFWRTPRGTVAMRSPLTGRVNVYNVMAAACAALERGMAIEQIAAAAAELRQVPGRFEIVPAEVTDFTVAVDYAHTEDALRNLMVLARELVRERGGRVITVFGCGGDRDRTKRPKMGRAAGEGSDLVVVTSDNPRSEGPGEIIEEVMVGVRETGVDCVVEEERAGAIEIAIRSARPGDIVLIAGKGHEKVQIFADGAVPFDDVAVAAEVLRGL
ncbi:MAG: UDP-N-acetylmuramoyl-L-alanyl-D-glutamate--2,6-diaminopimelate ligase [Acidobacteriaceae bacterium]